MRHGAALQATAPCGQHALLVCLGRAFVHSLEYSLCLVARRAPGQGTPQPLPRLEQLVLLEKGKGHARKAAATRGIERAARAGQRAHALRLARRLKVRGL